MMLPLFETIRRDSVISFPVLGGLRLDPPSFFTLFGRPVYFYGVLIALGFLLAILYCSRRAPEFGLTEDEFVDLMLRLIPLSIVGARLYFVAFRWRDYADDPLRVFALREGGLAIYGGIIAGVLVITVFCRRRRIPVTAMLDLGAFGVLIGQIIGRWGNFLNREAFGRETEIFCRMGLTDPAGNTVYVHPTFLYESLWNLIGFLFLRRFVRTGRRRYDGQVALLYFLWYGAGRAWIEGLRTDSLMLGNSGLRVSQLLSLALVLGTAVCLLLQSRKEHPPEALWVNRRKTNRTSEGGTDNGGL